jgi:hypothetical protein
MKKFKFLFSLYWQPVCIGLLIALAIVAILTFKLGSLVPGFSAQELATRDHSSTWQHIVDNPIYAPHATWQLGLQALHHKGMAAMRSASVVIGFVSIIAFYMLLRNWYSDRLSALMTLLYTTSSWFLLTTRSANPAVLYLLLPVLLLAGTWLHEGVHTKWAYLLACASSVLLLYCPGGIWLVVAGIIWHVKTFGKQLQLAPIWYVIAGIFVSIAACMPLIYSSYKDPNVFKAIIGLPAELPTLAIFIKNILRIPLFLFIRGSADPEYGIGHVPVLDAFSSAAVIAGLYALAGKWRLDRVKMIIGYGIFAVVLVGLHGMTMFASLLPVVYILIAAGIVLLLGQWFSVFPKNPVARNLAVVLVTIAISLTTTYHLTRYFVAWPNTPATKAVFNRAP